MKGVAICLVSWALFALCQSEEHTNQCEGSAECVPYYLCEQEADDSGLIDLRKPEDNPCSDVLSSCCASKLSAPQIPTGPINNECGIRNPSGVGFGIIGNENNESQFGEFPWTVAVIKVTPSLDRYLSVMVCGGSLIDRNVVLTAAHCVAGIEAGSLKIRAGEWDAQTTNEVFPHQERTVSDISIHPKYIRRSHHNDVALLFLSEPVNITENVNVVCLPSPSDVFDGSRCFAAGWGKDIFGKENRYSTILKLVELPIVSNDSCQDKWRGTRFGASFELSSSHICAGGEQGKDTCQVDGGSPLVCPIGPQKYVQAGVESFRISCGGDIPVVFNSVTHAREWIDEQMKLKSDQE